MIRDIRWAYELGFKRGWKVGNRRGRNASSSDPVSCDTEPTEERKFKSYAEYLWRERTESEGEVDKTTSEIRASGTFDILPTNECDHQDVAWFTVSFIESLIEQGYLVFCPKCGEKL